MLKTFCESLSNEVRAVLMGSRFWSHPSMSSAAFPHTKDPCREIHGGPAPESEKETKAVTDFIRSHQKSIKAYVTFHSYSQMLLFPYGYTSELPPNHEELVCRKSLWFMHWHHHWLSVCSSLTTWVILKKFHIWIPKKRTNEVYLRVKTITLG